MSYHAKRELSPTSIPGPSSHAKHARHADDVDELAGSDDGFPALETGAPTPAKEVNDDGETFFSVRCSSSSRLTRRPTTAGRGSLGQHADLHWCSFRLDPLGSSARRAG